MLQDIQHAIMHHQQAIDSTPDWHPNLPNYLSNLGVSYLRQFEHTGMLESIKNAIFYQQQAFNISARHADLPSYLGNLGTLYFN